MLSRTQTYAVSGVVNYGVGHPTAEDLNARIEDAFEQEERLELVRQLTKFLFDEVFTIPTVSVYHIWPLGPAVDDWEWTFPVVRVPFQLGVHTPSLGPSRSGKENDPGYLQLLRHTTAEATSGITRSSLRRI